MNKSELVAAMAESAGISKKEAEAALKGFTDAVIGEVSRGGRVQLVGFGTFECSTRSERQGRNPQTGEAMTIPAVKVPKFRPGRAFKDAANA